MITALEAANYLARKYNASFNKTISEMLLHKLLYFAQRESFIEIDTPLFLDDFEGWRFGPVIPSIRLHYNIIIQTMSDLEDIQAKTILDKTFLRYGEKDAWSLSILSHGEESWKRSRAGLPEDRNGHNTIHIDDIRIDAQRVKKRRLMLSV